MKATGIVRRIDDLGRVVIPKEIRRTMRIREGDPLEIFTTAQGEIIFKKFSPVGELSTFASQYADVLYKTTGIPAIVCDKDVVIAASGSGKKEVVERRITSTLEDIMKNKKSIAYTSEDMHKVVPVEGCLKHILVCAPITFSGDVGGAIMFISTDENTVATESQVKLVQVASMFLGKQIED
ncbi:MAG: AbrB/MazE/SpoVT family DNA-binding domain-containing protein [Oscillospiraceae bacterium]|nr:AbrB/MazE/SpoVT family DNA-binding domain-containing protein [Oscillospiraceae bacterium]